MDEFLQLIWSLASLLSIPLAIYLYLKSSDVNLDKLRKNIIKILSYQIWDWRNLTLFEIKTVIFSKLREKKKNPDSINSNEILEDLVVEIISNPLITKDRKSSIIENLKKLYNSDFITNKWIIWTKSKSKTININKELKQETYDNINDYKKSTDYLIYNRSSRFNEEDFFILTVSLLLIVWLTFSLFLEKSTIINYIMNSDNYIVSFNSGTVIAIIALLLLFLSNKYDEFL
jgi:hypothetical protein